MYTDRMPVHEFNIAAGNHRAKQSGRLDGPFGTLFYASWVLEHDGYLITENTRNRPWRHRVIGCGVGHDDADFAEVGRSMAAYYENGEAWGGSWINNEGHRNRMFDTLNGEKL